MVASRFRCPRSSLLPKKDGKGKKGGVRGLQAPLKSTHDPCAAPMWGARMPGCFSARGCHLSPVRTRWLMRGSLEYLDSGVRLQQRRLLPLLRNHRLAAWALGAAYLVAAQLRERSPPGDRFHSWWSRRVLGFRAPTQSVVAPCAPSRKLVRPGKVTHE
ncbi:hypothetical protein NDU88_004232 [Pleurodeles waltl]|uniref:Uncharacterized protein n=1 Tax=Pleurodeles waltl TaxID=8319 RepID=A0AAV7TRE0_PLEWA|nr:hypothetical protein NDU88_004232 [Pleurodeles waltl]